MSWRSLVKLASLFFVITTIAAASAVDVPLGFEHGNGELAKQFPKHSKRHIQKWEYDDCRPADYGIRQIGLERTGCYGECPIYTLIINSDGTFRYHGERFTKRRGNWYGSVENWRLSRVLQYVSEMGYFELYDEYTTNETDGSGAYTLVKSAKRRKIIFDYAGGPAKLVALEDMIDHLLDDAKWKRHQNY